LGDHEEAVFACISGGFMTIVAGCPRPGCINRGILVLDADSMFFLLNGTVLFVCETYPELREWDKRLPVIVEVLAGLLCIFRRCALDGDLYISGRILYEELDLVAPSQSVEKWLPGSHLNKLDKGHLRQLQQVIRGSLNPYHADDEVKNAVRKALGREVWPTDRDASNLVAGCELAQSGERTLVVAHDHGYEEPIKKLRLKKNLILESGRELSTTHLQRRPYENFLLNMHASCCLDSDRFRALSSGFYEAQIKRLGETENRRIKNLVIGSVLPFMEDMVGSIRKKESSPCFPA